MKHNAWKESFMRGVFFIAACASVLAVALICIFLVCKWAPGNERDRIWKIFKRNAMETEKQYLRYSANDRRKSVCDRRSDYFWRADRYPDIRIYGTCIVRSRSIDPLKIGNRTSGRNSFRSIWIFWIWS